MHGGNFLIIVGSVSVFLCLWLSLSILFPEQSMGYTVRVGEPDVTHRTSWPESTGEKEPYASLSVGP